KQGRQYTFYDFGGTFERLRSSVPSLEKSILVVVDGPPASTGERARYSALPAVLEFFEGWDIDIVVDDYGREDEKKVAALWMDELNAEVYKAEMYVKKMERDSCFIVAKYVRPEL